MPPRGALKIHRARQLKGKVCSSSASVSDHCMALGGRTSTLPKSAYLPRCRVRPNKQTGKQLGPPNHKNNNGITESQQTGMGIMSAMPSSSYTPTHGHGAALMLCAMRLIKLLWRCAPGDLGIASLRATYAKPCQRTLSLPNRQDLNGGSGQPMSWESAPRVTLQRN